MRRSRVHRMVLATCLGSLLLVIFYFQSSLNPGACTPPSMLFYNKLLQNFYALGPVDSRAQEHGEKL